MKNVLLALFFSYSLHAVPLKVPNDTYYKNAPDIRDHPGHYPFISHLTFRSICDHAIHQQTEWFDQGNRMKIFLYTHSHTKQF